MKTEAERLIRTLKRDHKATIKRLETARDASNIGTNSYRQYEQAIADERRKHVAQLVEFGVIAQDLQAQTKTEYIFVSHVAHAVTRETLATILAELDSKAHKGLHYSDKDEAIRKQLDEEFQDRRESNDAE
jgi:hypothetical protein